MMASTQNSYIGFSVKKINGEWNWSITSKNGKYYLENIVSPFGPVSVINTPIPSDILSAMYRSLQTVQEQFKPLISVTPNNIILFVVEGDSVKPIQNLQATNVGAFGSTLVPVTTSSVPWIFPTSQGRQPLDKNAVGVYGFNVNPSLLSSSANPLLSYLTFQDEMDSTVSVVVPVSLTVLPKPSIQVSTYNISLSYYMSTASRTPSQPVAITNSGPALSTLDVSIGKVYGNSWLDISDTSLQDIKSGLSKDVLVSISTTTPALPGVYIERLLIKSPNPSVDSATVEVTLTVYP